jgi:lysine 6-dehydrogenase
LENRYKGHVEKIKLLGDLGFFEEEKIDIDGVQVSPRKLTSRLFEKKLCKPKVKDLVALEVEVCGFKDSEETCYIYRLLDFYDKTRGITAMARTTAYPASITGLSMTSMSAKGVDRVGKHLKVLDETDIC